MWAWTASSSFDVTSLDSVCVYLRRLVMEAAQGYNIFETLRKQAGCGEPSKPDIQSTGA